MTDEESFQAALDANPDDAHCRLVFADWLDERDDPRGPGYRALGETWRRPHETEDEIRYYDAESYEGLYDGAIVDVCPESNLTHDWYKLLEAPRTFPPDDISTHYVSIWPSRREAEDAAALAFAKLPAKRQTELLGQVEVAR
jgi:uncharacterized protein (TIGR02996 family)